LEIKKATKVDIDWIIRHRIGMFRDMDWSDEDLARTEPVVRKFLEESWDNRITCFLAIEETQIVGGCAITLFSILPSSQAPTGIHGYIHNLYVEEEYRRKGIATKLVDHAIRFCKENNASRCWLHSTNMGLSIYLNSGFEKCDNYYGLSLTI
jgi:ribosomal protein S18 acetylase RimI-like enzyme